MKEKVLLESAEYAIMCADNKELIELIQNETGWHDKNGLKVMKKFINAYGSFVVHKIPLPIRFSHTKYSEPELFDKIYECANFVTRLHYGSSNPEIGWRSGGILLMEVTKRLRNIAFSHEEKHYGSGRSKCCKGCATPPYLSIFITHQSALLAIQSALSVPHNSIVIPEFGACIVAELYCSITIPEKGSKEKNKANFIKMRSEILDDSKLVAHFKGGTIRKDSVFNSPEKIGRASEIELKDCPKCNILKRCDCLRKSAKEKRVSAQNDNVLYERNQTTSQCDIPHYELSILDNEAASVGLTRTKSYPDFRPNNNSLLEAAEFDRSVLNQSNTDVSATPYPTSTETTSIVEKYTKHEKIPVPTSWNTVEVTPDTSQDLRPKHVTHRYKDCRDYSPTFFVRWKIDGETLLNVPIGSLSRSSQNNNECRHTDISLKSLERYIEKRVLQFGKPIHSDIQ